MSNYHNERSDAALTKEIQKKGTLKKSGKKENEKNIDNY